MLFSRAPHPEEHSEERSRPNLFLRIFFPVLLMLFAGLAFFAWTQHQELSRLREGPVVATAKEELVRAVALHVVLPQGEDPVLATVTDPEELSGQPFFTNAREGDKVLVYPKAKRAILYRPSMDRIIEMMPFDISAGTGAVLPLGG